MSRICTPTTETMTRHQIFDWHASTATKPNAETTNTMTNTKKIQWDGGRNRTGYITDWQPAATGSKYPEVGTALYVALCKNGSINWSERRPYPAAWAHRDGLV